MNTIVYVLTANTAEPKQYRVSILRTEVERVRFMTEYDSSSGFAILAVTESHQEFLHLLERYISLEASA